MAKSTIKREYFKFALRMCFKTKSTRSMQLRLTRFKSLPESINQNIRTDIAAPLSLTRILDYLAMIDTQKHFKSETLNLNFPKNLILTAHVGP